MAAAFLAAAPAALFADCASPSGLKGEIVYNDDYETMQFCDGQNWVSMSASGTAVESDPQVDTLTAAKWCKANAGGTAIDCASTTVDATAAGSTGYVQFHTAGTLDAEDQFIWDKTNNRLGIGSTAPAQTLDVVGTLALSGAATFASTLGVTGNFAINTNKFTVTAASGNTAIAGTLAVTGAVTGASFAGDGSALTALSASNLGSGTIPDARFPSTLPALSGVNLTNLNASNLASGTVATARLGTGTADNTTFLRGDNTWASAATTPGGSTGHVQFNNAGAFAGSASLFWDNSNSRLGIGTASPAYPLEVSGKAKSVTMLLTPGAGGAPTGTGAATYWNQGGTDLYYMTGNVGIGTATPSVALDVVGSQALSGNLSVGGTLNSIGNFSVATNKLTVAAASGNTMVAGTLTAANVIESTSGGFKFPDATTQTTAGGIPTGAVMAFDLASCPTGWSEYTAARGRVVRGIDNGAGNDPDCTRSPGATQADATASHLHSVDPPNTAVSISDPGHAHGPGSNTYFINTSASGASGAGLAMYHISGYWADAGLAGATAGATTGISASVDIGSFSSGSTGSSETRMKNVALLYCRKD